MQLNWGTGIFIFYTVFASSMLFMVYRSTTYDHSLVTDDYYAKDLAYQEHYQKLENSLNLSQDLEVSFDREQQKVRFQFPPDLGPISGEIHFFNPTTKRKDFKVPVQLHGEDWLEFPVEQLQDGLWKIKVDWKAGDTPYFQEKVVMI